MTGLDGEIPCSSSAAERVPPHAWFVGSAVFHYLGPSFAVLLFARVPVGGVAWLRVASAAVVFAAWRRPWRAVAASPAATTQLIAALGVVFAAMNICFYHAIDRLPLGTVAAIEFVGPVALALAGVRSGRNVAALVLAVTGVAALTDVHLEGDPAAFGWAVANAGLFTLYIVLAHRLAGADASAGPIDRLAAAMLVAAVVITPLGLAGAVDHLRDPVALAAGAGVGVTSSVIPYVFDQMAMARLPRATYALFVALLPATAVAIGIVVLAQVPQPVELLAVALVIAGVAVHREAEVGAPATRAAGTRREPPGARD